MGLTFEQKFYSLPDEVFVVHERFYHHNGDLIAITDIPEDENEAKEREKKLEEFGYVDRVCLEELVHKGFDMCKR